MDVPPRPSVDSKDGREDAVFVRSREGREDEVGETMEMVGVLVFVRVSVAIVKIVVADGLW